MTSRVGVIGGGLAGIAAALRCADSGCAVSLLEARSRLGGLASSFRRGELEVDNGQHVFLRCCTSYRALLERLGAGGMVTLQQRMDIPVHAPGRRPARLRRSRLPAPLHLAGALLRYHPLPVADRLRLPRAAWSLRTLDPTDPAVDARDFAGWLSDHGQRPRAIELFWDLVGVAALNAGTDAASLALAATVFRRGLLTHAAAADIGWSLVPLGLLHGDVAASRLAEAGVEVRTSSKVSELAPTPAGWRIRTGRAAHGEEELVFDRIVVAVPPAVAQRLLPVGVVDAPPGWADSLGSSPIVNVHVVYDRRVLDAPFLAAVESPVQWVFDRTRVSGAERVWSRGVQYLAVSLSAAHAEIAMPTRELRERVLPALAALLPAAGRARVLDFFVTREPHATFRAAPGSAAVRPPARTAAPHAFLAGAWTATGWPATMEGAVRSGETAAAAVLASTAPSPDGSPAGVAA